MPFANSPAGLVRQDVCLRELTTWKIGGIAQWYAEPSSTQELADLIYIARQEELPLHILGGGSNVLIADEGLRGLTVHLAKKAECGNLIAHAEAGLIQAGGAVSMPGLVHEASAQGLSGLEELAGIPGTVGGGICMNAGGAAWGLGLCATRIRGVDLSGDIITLQKKRFFLRLPQE